MTALEKSPTAPELSNVSMNVRFANRVFVCKPHLSTSRRGRSPNALPESDGKLGKQSRRHFRSKFLEQLYSAREVPVSDVEQPEIEGAQAPVVHYLDEPALLHQL